MLIRDTLKQDINRQINGVVKVGETDAHTLQVELSEYVVTREIEKNLRDFYTSFEQNSRMESSNIGVWISGFFGSGKSHFLKILSYLLENSEVQGKRAVDYFQEKTISKSLQDAINESKSYKVETILFNIDSKGPMVKDSSAILKTFSKVFYEHLGYFGQDLKIVELEKYLDTIGKFDLFKSKIKEKFNSDWEKFRKVLAIKENKFYDALGETLDISRSEAESWMREKNDGISIDEFVSDVKKYMDSKPAHFRLVFLVDEIGQYIGNNSDLMLNLQTIVEDLGSVCRGKVWVIVTSQESIDSITKNRMNDFSKISARFSTRLPLSSTSVDEVIKRRILEKVDQAKSELEGVFERNETVLRNLYTFDRKHTVSDIIAYRSDKEFVDSYPFAQYQFKLMQNAFIEIRKSGAAGQHMAGGERSMLSGFYEIANRMQDKSVGALVPLYSFYDTFNTFLQGSIRQVIDRADRAAYANEGLEEYDVNVLKLLFIMRHIDDIRPTFDNLVVLMVDHIQADKVKIAEQLKGSLARLMKENYVSKHIDEYLFLTDEEQAINKEIRDVVVDSAKITEAIHNRIFNDIYPLNKFKYGKYDFDVKRIIDNTVFGSSTSKLIVQVLTSASELHDSGDERLSMLSNGEEKKAVIVLSDKYKYFNELESAEKIRMYVRSRNVSTLPEATQTVIRAKQQQASNHEANAKSYLERAIADATVYIGGEKLNQKTASVNERLSRILKLLVEDVYSKLSLVDENFENDNQILAILNMPQEQLEGLEKNKLALDDVMKFMEVQKATMRTVSMGDIQKRYQDIPYGFREIDIAAIVAQLLVNRKLDLHYTGAKVAISDRKIVELLRKRSVVDSVKVSMKETIDGKVVQNVAVFMKEYYGAMPVAEKDDDMFNYLVSDLSRLLVEVNSMEKQYEALDYPGKSVVIEGRRLLNDILKYKGDSIALLRQVDDLSSELLDWKEDFEEVNLFFTNQKDIFKDAVLLKNKIASDRGFFDGNSEFGTLIEDVNTILKHPKPYSKMNELRLKTQEILMIYNTTLQEKISEAEKSIQDIEKEVTDFIQLYPHTMYLLDNFTSYLKSQLTRCYESKSISPISGIVIQANGRKHQIIQQIASIPVPREVGVETPPIPVNEKSTHISKTFLVPTKKISSEEDIEQVLNEIRNKLKEKLRDYDSVTIS